MSKRKRQRVPGPSGFGHMWRAATTGAGLTDVKPYRESCVHALELLPVSRTIIVAREQAEAIGVLSDDELAQVAPTLRAPFPQGTLLDVGGAGVSGSNRPADAVLVYEQDDRVHGLISRAGTVMYMPPEALDGTALARLRDWTRENGPINTSSGPVDFTGPDLLAPESMTVGLLAMLQSVNVELVETAPYPKAHRAAGLPRYEVAIRRTLRRGERRAAHVEVDWSHQWEVRGHPKHFGEDTQLFRATERDQPEKILDLPDRGRVVRLWCPPHVKGPEDKPLVPKLRRMETA